MSFSGTCYWNVLDTFEGVAGKSIGGGSRGPGSRDGTSSPFPPAPCSFCCTLVFSCDTGSFVRGSSSVPALIQGQEGLEEGSLTNNRALSGRHTAPLFQAQLKWQLLPQSHLERDAAGSQVRQPMLFLPFSHYKAPCAWPGAQPWLSWAPRGRACWRQVLFPAGGAGLTPVPSEWLRKHEPAATTARSARRCWLPFSTLPCQLVPVPSQISP